MRDEDRARAVVGCGQGDWDPVGSLGSFGILGNYAIAVDLQFSHAAILFSVGDVV